MNISDWRRFPLNFSKENQVLGFVDETPKPFNLTNIEILNQTPNEAEFQRSKKTLRRILQQFDDRNIVCSVCEICLFFLSTVDKQAQRG